MPQKKQTEGVDVLEVEEIPVMHLRLCDRRKSGFIMDLNGVEAGSKGTEHYHEFDSPLARFVPRIGFRLGSKVEEKNGKKSKISYHEPIRYIKEQPEISLEVQKALGIQPSRASTEDLIHFRRGEFSVAREGSFIGQFDYLKEAFYNKSNPNRSPKAAAIYEEVVLDKVEEDLNEYDLQVADCVKFMSKFYQKGPKGYTYNEEKIDALCELFAVFAETPAGKVTALNSLAKLDPKNFLEKAEKFEQTNLTHIGHALQLGVIQIASDGTVMYANKDKIVMHLGTEPLTRAKQIEKISVLLETKEFAAAKEELMFELELAKEKQLQK